MPRYRVLGIKKLSEPHSDSIKAFPTFCLAKHYTKYSVNIIAEPIYIYSQKSRFTEVFLRLADCMKRMPGPANKMKRMG